MTDARYALLDGRGAIALSGPDTLTLLQGLATNDVMPAGAGHAVYAALLTPQGKYLHDFILVPQGTQFYLDCERDRLDDLKRRLMLYRLRAKVTIEDASDAMAVFALFGEGAAAKAGLGGEAGVTVSFGGGTAYVDPRLARAGARAMLLRADGAAAIEAAGFAAAARSDYDRLRHELGIAEGGAELGADRTLALEAGLDALNGISFSKGCYVGQEVTSRMRTRKLVKKRIVPVAIEGPMPAPGTPVLLGDADAGEIRAAENGMGLALLRLELLAQATEGTAFTASGAKVVPQPAAWLNLPIR